MAKVANKGETFPDIEALLSLDKLIHEPARLAIMTILSSADEVEFKFIENLTGLSKGNLSSHSAKLEGAGYLEVLKSFRGRRPVTHFRITEEGQKALEAYHRQLKTLFGGEDL